MRALGDPCCTALRIRLLNACASLDKAERTTDALDGMRELDAPVTEPSPNDYEALVARGLQLAATVSELLAAPSTSVSRQRWRVIPLRSHGPNRHRFWVASSLATTPAPYCSRPFVRLTKT
ncbi:MAG TPA: hypothetical protein VJN70_03955 [Gemmatimonadaceae bacterium]|nr:hypothetical protein [Gemmatimonadaceae bacterium]